MQMLLCMCTGMHQVELFIERIACKKESNSVFLNLVSSM